MSLPPMLIVTRSVFSSRAFSCPPEPIDVVVAPAQAAKAIADSFAVIFDANLELPLPFVGCCQWCRKKNQHQRQRPPRGAGD